VQAKMRNETFSASLQQHWPMLSLIRVPEFDSQHAGSDISSTGNQLADHKGVICTGYAKKRNVTTVIGPFRTAFQG